MKFRQLTILIIALFISIPLWAASTSTTTPTTTAAPATTSTIIATPTPESESRIKKFISDVATEYDFEEDKLASLFAQAKINQKALDLMERPYESKPWYIYRKHFLSPKRIEQGAQFWHTYNKQLTATSEKTGIPPEVIVAIIGVESHYGQLKGGFSAFDVLYTFSFYYPRRETFFKKELKEFLLLCREQNLDPLTVGASYAGALGQPQFMPSSYRAYGKSYTGLGAVNLFNDESDVIASIGNYFYVHGWQKDQPIVVKARVRTKDLQALLAESSIGNTSKIKRPSLTLKDLAAHQVYSTVKLPPDTKAILMSFDLEDGAQEYWLGLNNFYVITRYNTSKLYAMAVYQLAEAIKAQHKKDYPKE